VADRVGQGRHQQQAPPARPQPVLRQKGVGDAGGIEARALVGDADDEVFIVAFQLD
jgi:hypothetical protein